MKIITSSTLFVLYSQIAVFDPNLQKPFNEWTSEHSRQGFSWRPLSVSFAMLIDSGNMHIDIVSNTIVEIAEDTVRAIQVPFDVQDSGVIEIATITESMRVELPPGKYALIFETCESKCTFTFIPQQDVHTEILRADSEITRTTDFLMDAEPG
jgi:hypothetical protein